MRSRALPSSRAARRPAAAAVALLALAAGLTACTSASQPDDGPSARPGAAVGSDAPAPEPVRLTTSFSDPASVPIDAPVTVTTPGGTLDTVQVTSAAGVVPGTVTDGTWTSEGRLEPGTDYAITASATRSDGRAVERTRRFHTVDLTLDEQTYAAVAPLDGETVGVGMPVVVTFDLPVTDRALFEQHMQVTSTPAQKGSWYWLSDREAHWRPQSYWKAGSKVSVDLDINSLPAGNGIYGQEDRQISFEVGDAHVYRVDARTHQMRVFSNGSLLVGAGGDAHVYRVDARTHQMRVFSNGSLLRTFPITTGKAGFITRSGTKVIMEKFAERRMNSETVGINRNSPEAYDIDDVQWAMRLTYSGEFIHAAPWSVGSQGSANVSHGCTGMSTADAGWLYAMSRRGDVVEYTGTDRPMTLGNGWGDWNLSAKAWKQGSALS